MPNMPTANPIQVYAPDGLVGTAHRSLASSPSTLAGRRIAVLDNGKPGAAFILEELAANLSRRTQSEFIGVFAKGSAATPCEDELFQDLLGRADIILTGTAD